MPSPSGVRERSATSPLDRSYTASPSVSGTIPAPMLAAPQLLASPAPSPPGSRSSSRGNSISPTPRKRYTVALSGRPDGATSPARSPSSASISPTTSRDKDGRISPFPEPKGDDIVERVYGIGLSSTSLSSAAAATTTTHPPIAATSSSAEGLSAQTQVHNAMVTPTSPMTPSFNFDSTTSLTNSLAASLKTPETVGKSSRRKWVAPATDSETESDSTSPSTSNFGHSSGAATTEISPNSSMTASSVSTGPAPSDDKEREAPKAKMRSYEHLPSVPPVEEVTEPEEEDDVAVKVEDDDDDDGSLFKVGTTPIALHRITSPPTSPTPPPKASPQPLGSSRTRTQTLPALKGTTSGGSTVTSQRKYPLPERSASPSKSSMASIPRSFGGLPPSVRERGVNQDSVSSMASAASTSTSTSSMITSSSGVTSSSVMSESGRSTSGASSASGSYRTPANNSPPNVRSSTYSTSSYNTAPSTANGRDRDQRGANPRPRALTTNTVVPSSAAGSSNTTLRHTPASPPFSAASLRSTPGSPTYGSDRDRSDLDVFSSRSSTFVDPLLVRRRERERQSMEVKANAMAVAKNATAGRGAGKKPPVGELVAFFQAARD
ncbi:hypothetical protein DL93DRAFT_84444 [Clavulina sp. PMI_390]|nr:hypothetical protein DL93DRAFT_84444 [Clavulina sp. PMI_390]